MAIIYMIIMLASIAIIVMSAYQVWKDKDHKNDDDVKTRWRMAVGNLSVSIIILLLSGVGFAFSLF